MNARTRCFADSQPATAPQGCRTNLPWFQRIEQQHQLAGSGSGRGVRQVPAGQLGHAQARHVGHHGTVIHQDAGRMGA